MSPHIRQRIGLFWERLSICILDEDKYGKDGKNLSEKIQTLLSGLHTFIPARETTNTIDFPLGVLWKRKKIEYINSEIKLELIYNNTARSRVLFQNKRNSVYVF